MCGIVAYTGPRDASLVILKGLRRLEYRGYDSAGLAILNNKLRVYKTKGKVADLETKVNGQELHGQICIGHTRWATHGPPNDVNAHPHLSSDGRWAMVHNGIIENYAVLREEIQTKGYTLTSETDTEVLLKFIESIKKDHQTSLEEALRIALKRVVGTYVLVLIDKEHPDTLLAARKGAPLVVGIGTDEYFLASDAIPIVEYTRDVVYVEDYEIVKISNGKLSLKNLDNEELTPQLQHLDMELEQISKGGYKHFMLKEIFEQPASLRDCFRGRISIESHHLELQGLDDHMDRFLKARRIIFIACGTSWHAGLTGKYIIERLCRIPVSVEYASEFRYRDPVLYPDDVVVAISQSGETADSLVALELAKEQGAFTFGIINVVGSSIARMTGAGIYTHSGPEIGVASTKAFTGQLGVIMMMALQIGKAGGQLESYRYGQLLDQLIQIPAQYNTFLEGQNERIKLIAKRYRHRPDFLYLGRDVQFPIALEGALKLKEISYLHAEGYPAAEMKHGPIALVDDGFPVVCIALKNDPCYAKIVNNIQEIKARNGRVIAIIRAGDMDIRTMVDDFIEIPPCDPMLSPLLSVLPMQLLAYWIGEQLGINVDQPRNLAKSVTVE